MLVLGSSYERGKQAEERAAAWLQKKYNVPFSRKNLQVGWKHNGTAAMHSFDLVSEDNQIVAEVKSHQFTRSGNTPSGKISDTYQACYMLEKTHSQRKLLVLTDPQFYETFKRFSEGKISKEIEIMLLDTSANGESINSETSPPSLSTHQEKCKETEFNVFWHNLKTWLSRKRSITNWTAKRGEIGENFEAVAAEGNYILVFLKSGQIQTVPKKDFKVIYENWDAYIKEIIPRYYFVKGPIAESRFTKYTISILHQYLRAKERI